MTERYAPPVRGVEILGPPQFEAALADLAELLYDAVDSGASVGFVKPFTRADAETWWRTLAPDVRDGHLLVMLYRVDGRAVGTAQLRLVRMPNAQHRAEVAKVLVHREARRRGYGRDLMRAVEAVARKWHRTLLILDTIAGSDAERLYERLGWIKVASIPRYAAFPDGTLAPTTIFYKELAD
jgi:GNAT superfamily N-acetyltransferase